MSPRRARAIKDRESDDPAAELREHLIDAAERLLSDHQVSAITTRDIARAAGVSDGVLYNYFADKNELVLTALVRRFTGLVARFDAGDLPKPGDATVEENLLAYALASLDFAAEVLPLFAALMSEPPLLHRYFAEIHRLPFLPQRIAEYLQGEQRLGRIAAVDAMAATTLLFGAVTALTHSGPLRSPSHEDRAAQLPAIVATLVRGLNPPQ